jgi:hypothetical protein
LPRRRRDDLLEEELNDDLVLYGEELAESDPESDPENLLQEALRVLRNDDGTVSSPDVSSST